MEIMTQTKSPAESRALICIGGPLDRKRQAARGNTFHWRPDLPMPVVAESAPDLRIDYVTYERRLLIRGLIDFNAWVVSTLTSDEAIAMLFEAYERKNDDA